MGKKDDKNASTEDMIEKLERRNKILSTFGLKKKPKQKPKSKPKPKPKKKSAYSPEQSARDWMNLA